MAYGKKYSSKMKKKKDNPGHYTDAMPGRRRGIAKGRAGRYGRRAGALPEQASPIAKAQMAGERRTPTEGRADRLAAMMRGRGRRRGRMYP